MDALFPRVGDPLERGRIPQRPDVAVEPLLGARLEEGRHRALPDAVIEQLERPALAQAGLLEIGFLEDRGDRAVDFVTVGHGGAEAIQ